MARAIPNTHEVDEDGYVVEAIYTTGDKSTAQDLDVVDGYVLLSCPLTHIGWLDPARIHEDYDLSYAADMDSYQRPLRNFYWTSPKDSTLH